MQDASDEQRVSGPVVDTKDVEAMMRPAAPWAVAHGDQRADQQIQRRQSDCHETDIGGEINRSHAESEHGGCDVQYKI